MGTEGATEHPPDVIRASRRARHRYLVTVGTVLFVSITVLVVFVVMTRRADEDRRLQASLDPFYLPPDPLAAGAPGELIRVEPLTPAPPGTRAWRILYHSQAPDGRDVAVSGMVFAPDSPPPPGGRPVLAWAHPTSGMSPDCAPSRQEDPGSATTWLSGALEKGWVVAATDYYGLGTPGVTLPYLIGPSAAHDVLNSVRAARLIDDAGAGTTVVTYGHSEGGHASLWTGLLAADYAPELELVAVAAAAPAAELKNLMDDQWDQPIGQVLGPYAVEGWSEWVPGLDPSQVLTDDGVRALPALVSACIVEVGVEGMGRAAIGDAFFARNPNSVPGWAAAAERNTPGPPPRAVPALIAQGTEDRVVLPPSTTSLVERFCGAGSTLAVHWMPGEGHTGAGNVAGPVVVDWLADRLVGEPVTAPCGPSSPPS
jgi:alpha-beta hydrolase superfamily lysophospholipase